MTTPVVLIAEELSPATIDALGPDFEVRHTDGADRSALLPALDGVDAVLIRSATTMDAEAIAAARGLKVIARAGVGLDNVDIDAATKAGVMVVNAPTSNITSAAELAIGLMLASARNIAPANAALKNGAVAVVGIPDREFGQRLKAVVVPKRGAILDQTTLCDWLKTRVARYQMPAIIEFRAELPYTPLGKIDKKSLRDTHTG